MELNLYHYFFIIGFDIIIVLVLIAIFIRSTPKDGDVSQIDILKIKSLKSSLEKSMADSEKTTRELLDRLNDRIRKLNEILDTAQQKERSLEKYINRAESLQQSPAAEQYRVSHETLDPYKKATELLAMGFSNDDVCRQSGLSSSEIELIKQIGRYKSQ